jgi:cytoskeletal protein CcmA (bactofilin family)
MNIGFVMLKGNRKNPLLNHSFDSILGEGMVIDGRLKVSGSVLIHGTVTGDIEANSSSEMVIVGVGESGSVKGNILADQVMIAGKVLGDVNAKLRVEMMSTGVIEGNLEYQNMVMDEGAVIIGRIIPLNSQSKKQN